MAKVFLRVYNHEIESMIEGGQLDEAVAHCQHILKTFPMYIETYRLLGKAFLEARRYTDAADIFQRALMVVPDDFVSHVGMSIIRDDENKLDDAIWHMERAFEVQPSNSAIQGELRRLYGRRDGVEPSKIRLSRDALANMYSQGELFNQAIAEIRTVLAEDTNRPDLQVMLARAYYRSGQKVEAAEMAAALLKKYPYCMDALRVLVDVLPGTARAENTQVYRQRLHMLDPYSSFAIDSVFASDQVVDSAVNLERLEYRSGSTPSTSQPDWASSLGIKLNNNENQAENPPEWMLTTETTDQPVPNSPESSSPEAPPAPAAAETGVPEWMRSAGWQESSGAEQNTSIDSGEGLPDEQIAKADIPDWLQSMAPADVTDSTTLESEESAEPLPVGSDGIPDWLKPVTPPGSVTSDALTSDQHADGPLPANDVGTPDWLNPSVPAESGADNPDTTLQPADSQPSEGDATPDWFKSMATDEESGELEEKAQPPVGSPQTPVDTLPPVEDATPDWLKPPVQADISSDSVPSMPAESQAANDEDVPDWLKSMAPPSSVGETPVDVSQAQSTQTQTPNDDDVPDWLKSMAPTDIVGQAPLEPQQSVEPPAAAGDDFPDWLKSMAPAEMSAAANAVSTPASEPVDVLSLDSHSESTPPGINPADGGASPEKPTGMGARADAAALTASTIPQSLPGSQPGAEETIPPEPVTQETAKPTVPASAPVATDEAFQPSGEVKPLNIGDDALGWLENLAAKQGARPEEMLTDPQERSVEMPEWLRHPDEQPSKPVETAEPVPDRKPPETLPLEPLTHFETPSTMQPAHTIDEVFPVPSETPPALPPEEPVTQNDRTPVTSEDDTMAWLEHLGADQGTGFDERPAESAGSEDKLPDWIQNGQADQPEASVPDEVPASEPGTNQPAADITITSWLSKMDVEEALGTKPAEPIGAPQNPSAMQDLPDWLKDLEKPAAPVETPKAEGDLPEWLRNPIPPAPPEPVASLPGDNSTSEPEMPTWLDDNIPSTGQAAPTQPEEWLPAETKSAPLPDSLPPVESMPISESAPTNETASAIEPASVEETQPVVVPLPPAEPPSIPVQPPGRLATLKQTGMLSHIPIQDKDAELLSNAQTVFDQNSLDEAMKQYGKLIKKGRLLDEVIHDLREGLYRYPVDVIVWQTLGDAYMRANRLQDALDAYTKAEELLR